jgi:hypothetical protein
VKGSRTEELKESPIRVEFSQQLGSRPYRQTGKPESEAKEGKNTGFVLSPEMGIVVDIRISFYC